MGAAQSGQTRSISVDNPNNFVKVTDDVVQRIRGQKTHNPTKVTSEMSNSGEPASTNVPSSYPNAPTAARDSVVFYAEPTITALDVRRQKEQELRNNDAYWAMRLAQQEKQLQKTNAILEKEFDASLQNVRSRFASSPAHLQAPPCRELKQKVHACYATNTKEPLACGPIVNEWLHCVNASYSSSNNNNSTSGVN